MRPVADHQPPSVIIELVGERLDVGGDLRMQRGSEHLPRAVTHDRVKQRPGPVLLRRLGVVVDYLEHGRTFPNQRANAGPDQTSLGFRSSSGRCVPSPHPAEDHPQVLIIAPMSAKTMLNITTTHSVEILVPMLLITPTA